MKAIIRYEGTEEEKLAAALQDVQAYLGKRYESVLKSFMESLCMLSRKDIFFFISFLGISGKYPENALFYEICRRTEEEIA